MFLSPVFPGDLLSVRPYIIIEVDWEGTLVVLVRTFTGQ